MNGINSGITKQSNDKIGVAIVGLISIGLTFGAMSISGDDLKQQQRIPVFTSISESLHSDYEERSVAVEDRRQATDALEGKPDSESEKERQGAQTETFESVSGHLRMLITIMSMIIGLMLFLSGMLHIVKASRSEGNISPTAGWMMMFMGSALSVFGSLFNALLNSL